MKQSKQISVVAASRRDSVLGALLLTAVLIPVAFRGEGRKPKLLPMRSLQPKP